MELRSSAFQEGGLIPRKYTCDGADISPPLSWSGAPTETQSFALICDDPDAPMSTWVHWVAWNIPGTTQSLSLGLPKVDSLPGGMQQGTTDFGRIGYDGPCPPSGTHRYFFNVYALDITLTLPASTTKPALEQAMRGHILTEAPLMGLYTRG